MESMTEAIRQTIQTAAVSGVGTKAVTGLVGIIDSGPIASAIQESVGWALLSGRANDFRLGMLRELQGGPRRYIGLTPYQAIDRATVYLRDWSLELNDYLGSTLIAAAGSPRALAIVNKNAAMYQTARGMDSLLGAISGKGYQYGLDTMIDRYWRKELAPFEPSPGDLFIMEAKGLVTPGRTKTSLRERSGFSSYDADAYITHLDYDPSFSELLRITDVFPLPPTYVVKKLKAMGMSQEDITVFSTAISKRTIKDELARAWSSITSSYAWGLFTAAEIETIMQKWELSDAEKVLRLATLELERTKTIMRMNRDAKIWLFRKNALPGAGEQDDLLFTALKNMGVNAEVANAIVNLEDARKGIVWEEPP